MPPRRRRRRTGIVAAAGALAIALAATAAAVITLTHPVTPAQHTINVVPPPPVTYSSAEIQAAKDTACSGMGQGRTRNRAREQRHAPRSLAERPALSSARSDGSHGRRKAGRGFANRLPADSNQSRYAARSFGARLTTGYQHKSIACTA